MRRRPFATVLVGGNALLREGLARILSAADFRVVASASNVDELTVGPVAQHQSILLIIDAGDDPNAAVSQIELFKEQHPAGRVAVLADHYQLADMVSAFRAGTNVFFVKVKTCDAFIKALELVMLGETILPSELLSCIPDPEDADEHPAIVRGGQIATGELTQDEATYVSRLSAREKSILRCIVEGASNKLIARQVKIAEATVKVHVKAILRKVRVSNRTQAAIWAMNNGSFIWATDPPTVAGPPPSVPEKQVGAAQLAAPIDSGDGVNHVALVGIDSLVRKGVNRKDP
jgi:DNA-binding NarL/FixJ family response regulator